MITRLGGGTEGAAGGGRRIAPSQPAPTGDFEALDGWGAPPRRARQAVGPDAAQGAWSGAGRRRCYGFSRYPVRNIHHRMPRQAAMNAVMKARLAPTLTSPTPWKLQLNPLTR